MISKRIEEAFNKQINAELYSSYLYLSMSAYFESLGLRGFAGWMRVQAQEEIAHAMKFYSHVVERGGRVSLKGIDVPPVEWSSPLNAFEEAYRHERHVTELISGLVNLAAEEKDHASQVFLQWFVSEQVEEEASADEIVQKLGMVKESPGALYMLDREMGKRSFTYPPAGSE
jgi:ferritin